MSRASARGALLALCLTGCGVHAAELAVVTEDSAGRPLAEAVVYLTGPGVAAAPPAREVVIDQKNRQFVPRISVVPAGTAVSFPNSDQVRHSVYSFSPAKTFSLKLYAGKPASPIVFDRPGVVVLGCNIHDAMSAWVAVVDTRLYGKTDAAGRFVFHGLPPGEYQWHAWYPGMAAPATRAVVLAASDATLNQRLDAQPLGEASL